MQSLIDSAANSCSRNFHLLHCSALAATTLLLYKRHYKKAFVASAMPPLILSAYQHNRENARERILRLKATELTDRKEALAADFDITTNDFDENRRKERIRLFIISYASAGSIWVWIIHRRLNRHT